VAPTGSRNLRRGRGHADHEYEWSSVEREVPLSDGLALVLNEQKLRVGGWGFLRGQNEAGHTKGER
jgi:hypothetical protein